MRIQERGQRVVFGTKEQQRPFELSIGNHQMVTRYGLFERSCRSLNSVRLVPAVLVALMVLSLPAVHLAYADKPPPTKDRGFSPSQRGRPPEETPSVRRTNARVALVIGNGDYFGRSQDLKNPPADARAIARVLERLGFEVLRGVDLSLRAMRGKVRSFAQKARGAEVAVAFYAGHGMERAGTNFLISVDPLKKGKDLTSISLPLNRLLEASNGAKTRLMILDACRNNPPEEETANAASDEATGWVPLSVTEGTMLAYGTAPGEVAADSFGGQSRNAPFTRALLENIEVPGLEMAELMRRVTRMVKELTNGRQQPWLSSSYTEAFFFVPPRSDAIAAFRPQAASAVSVSKWFQQGRKAYKAKRYDDAFRSLEQAATSGHPGAQFYLGQAYIFGRGAKKDPNKALEWLQLSAARGYGRAQFALGGFYSGGFGRLRRDDKRAADLYERAAQQGLSPAMLRLGIVYESGRGRKKNLSEAVRWYEQAAAHGHPDGHKSLKRLAEREKNKEARRALERRMLYTSQ